MSIATDAWLWFTVRDSDVATFARPLQIQDEVAQLQDSCKGT